MSARPLSHIRNNLVAYLALSVALSGTGYAAIRLPANSVGAPQIRNHSITPVKLDPEGVLEGVIGASSWMSRVWGRVVVRGG